MVLHPHWWNNHNGININDKQGNNGDHHTDVVTWSFSLVVDGDDRPKCAKGMDYLILFTWMISVTYGHMHEQGDMAW